MSTVRFLPSGFETQVKVGTALVDTCDEHPEAEVPFSCRSASCGTSWPISSAPGRRR
jgi:hypothetical protein